MSDKISSIGAEDITVKKGKTKAISAQVKELEQKTLKPGEEVIMLGVDEDSKLSVNKPAEKKESAAQSAKNAQKDSSTKVFQDKKIMALAKNMGYGDAVLKAIQKSTREIQKAFEESLSQSSGNIDKDYENAIKQYVEKNIQPPKTQEQKD